MWYLSSTLTRGRERAEVPCTEFCIFTRRARAFLHGQCDDRVERCWGRSKTDLG
jgi:hypothetical protein